MADPHKGSVDRRKFLKSAAGVVAVTTSSTVHAQNHEHDHDHQIVPSDPALRTKALESLLVEKGIVDPKALDALVDAYENKIGPKNGARAVARAARRLSGRRQSHLSLPARRAARAGALHRWRARQRLRAIGRSRRGHARGRRPPLRRQDDRSLALRRRYDCTATPIIVYCLYKSKWRAIVSSVDFTDSISSHMNCPVSLAFAASLWKFCKHTS